MRKFGILVLSCLVVTVDFFVQPIEITGQTTRRKGRCNQRLLREIVVHLVIDLHIIHIHSQRILLLAINRQIVTPRRSVRNHIRRTERFFQFDRQRIVHKHLRDRPAHFQADVRPSVFGEGFFTSRFGGFSFYGHRQRRLARFIDRQHKAIIFIVSGIEKHASRPFEPHGEIDRRFAKVKNRRFQLGILGFSIEGEPFFFRFFIHEEGRLTEQLTIVGDIPKCVIDRAFIMVGKGIFQQNGFRDEHVVVGLEVGRQEPIFVTEFRAGADDRCIGAANHKQISRAVFEFFGVHLDAGFAVDDVTEHAGEPVELDIPSDDRLTEHLGIVFDDGFGTGDDGVLFDARVIEHLGSVEHHRVGGHIGGISHFRIGTDPSATVFVTCAQTVTQYIIRTIIFQTRIGKHENFTPSKRVEFSFPREFSNILLCRRKTLFHFHKIVDRFFVIRVIGQYRPIAKRTVVGAFDGFVPLGGIGQLIVAVFRDVRMRTPGGTVFQRHLERIHIRMILFVNFVHGSGIFRDIPGDCKRGGRHCQPEPPVARLNLHRHFSLIPHRRIARNAVSIDGNNARPPIAKRILIKNPLKINGDFFGALIGDQSRDMHTVGMGGLGGGTAVDAFVAVDTGEVRTRNRNEILFDLQFRLGVDFCPSRKDRRDKITELNNRVVPQPTLEGDFRVGVHGGRFVDHRADDHRSVESPVGVFAESVLTARRRIPSVKNIHQRTLELMVHLHRLRRIVQDLVGIGNRLSATIGKSRAGTVSPFMIKRRRIRTANPTSTHTTAVISRHGKFSVIVGSRNQNPILVGVFVIPSIQVMADIFVQRPEIFQIVKNHRTVSRGGFRIEIIDPNPALTGRTLRSGEHRKVFRFDIHPAGFTQHFGCRTILRLPFAIHVVQGGFAVFEYRGVFPQPCHLLVVQFHDDFLVLVRKHPLGEQSQATVGQTQQRGGSTVPYEFIGGFAFVGIFIAAQCAVADQVRIERTIADDFRIDQSPRAVHHARACAGFGAKRPGAFDGCFGDFVGRNVVHPFSRPPRHRATRVIVGCGRFALDVKLLGHRMLEHGIPIEEHIVKVIPRPGEDFLPARIPLLHRLCRQQRGCSKQCDQQAQLHPTRLRQVSSIQHNSSFSLVRKSNCSAVHFITNTSIRALSRRLCDAQGVISEIVVQIRSGWVYSAGLVTLPEQDKCSSGEYHVEETAFVRCVDVGSTGRRCADRFATGRNQSADAQQDHLLCSGAG